MSVSTRLAHDIVEPIGNERAVGDIKSGGLAVRIDKKLPLAHLFQPSFFVKLHVEEYQLDTW